jgi:hypothetical protein
MKRVPNRTRLRREYLRKKGKQCLYVSVGVVTVLCGYGLLCVMRQPILDNVRAHPDLRTILGAISTVGFVLGIYFLLAREAIKFVQAAQSMEITYVPPVTADTLSAEDVLVRGAQQPPVVQSEVLLRATHTEPKTPAAELLRESQAEPAIAELPVVHGEALLRAAKGQETPQEELLRVEQGQQQ